MKKPGKGAGGMGWFPRIFILPHVIIGLCLIVYPFLVVGTICFGTDVKAVVFDKFTFRNDEDGRINKIAIRYKWNGREFVDKESVGYLEYESYQVGDPVIVRFLPVAELKQFNQSIRKPGEPVAWPDLSSVLFFAFFAVFWNLICGVFVIILYVWPVVEWWLLRRGAVSQGFVTGKSSYSDSDGDKHLNVEYTYIPGKRLSDSDSLIRNDRERQINAKTSVNREQYERLEKGDAICVLHMRKWPSINTIFELSNYELEGM